VSVIFAASTDWRPLASLKEIQNDKSDMVGNPGHKLMDSYFAREVDPDFFRDCNWETKVLAAAKRSLDSFRFSKDIVDANAGSSSIIRYLSIDLGKINTLDLPLAC
jgi:hypothetical protein